METIVVTATILPHAGPGRRTARSWWWRRHTLGRMTDVSTAATAVVADLAGRARVAARDLALLSRARKDEVLAGLADALDAATERIGAANAEDLKRGRDGGMPEGGDFGWVDGLNQTASNPAELRTAVYAAIANGPGDSPCTSHIHTGFSTGSISVSSVASNARTPRTPRVNSA